MALATDRPPMVPAQSTASCDSARRERGKCGHLGTAPRRVLLLSSALLDSYHVGTSAAPLAELRWRLPYDATRSSSWHYCPHTIPARLGSMRGAGLSTGWLRYDLKTIQRCGNMGAHAHYAPSGEQHPSETLFLPVVRVALTLRSLCVSMRAGDAVRGSAV